MHLDPRFHSQGVRWIPPESCKMNICMYIINMHINLYHYRKPYFIQCRQKCDIVTKMVLN